MIAGSLLIAFGVVGLTSRIVQELESRKRSAARRRESMRQVTELWHFRQWERDLSS